MDRESKGGGSLWGRDDALTRSLLRRMVVLVLLHHDFRRIHEVRSARCLHGDLRATSVPEQQSFKSRGATADEELSPDSRLETFAPRALEPESVNPMMDTRRRSGDLR